MSDRNKGNKPSPRDWWRLRMLREMMLVQKRYQMEHGITIPQAPYYRGVENVLASDYTLAKQPFKMYAQQSGLRRIKSHYETETNAALANFVSTRERTSLRAAFGKEKVWAEKRFRGEYVLHLKWGWYYKVWTDVYAKKYTSEHDGRIVLEAEKIRLPDRKFFFFKVKYIDIGDDEVKDGWAARDRNSFITVVCHHSMRIIDRANIALSEYIMKELSGGKKE